VVQSAAKQGNQDAIKNRKLVAQLMTPARIDEALRFCGRLEVEKTALRCGFRAATRCVGRKAERVAGVPQPGGDENSGVCRLRTIQVSRGEAVLPLHLATGQRARADRPMDRPSGLQPSPGPDIKVRYHARTDVPVRVRIPAGLPRIEFSGTAVVAPATAPINRPGDEPEANDHPVDIRLARRFCQSRFSRSPSHDEGRAS
jgi:hypothetical protein